jgi:hypothetical protein
LSPELFSLHCKIREKILKIEVQQEAQESHEDKHLRLFYKLYKERASIQNVEALKQLKTEQSQ